MGYTITIGEATFQTYDDDIRIEAAFTTDPAAPNHCKYTQDSNNRSPSYTAWDGFCRSAGIHELFYGEGWDSSQGSYRPCSASFHREVPLLRDHPGAKPITQKDADYVANALAKYKADHPDTIAGFFEDDGTDNGNDHTLARLLWLNFWFDWAVKNCENPVITNS